MLTTTIYCDGCDTDFDATVTDDADFAACPECGSNVSLTDPHEDENYDDSMDGDHESALESVYGDNSGFDDDDGWY